MEDGIAGDGSCKCFVFGDELGGEGSFDSSSASLGVAQDFAWRLRRRQNGSTLFSGMNWEGRVIARNPKIAKDRRNWKTHH